MSGRPKRSCKRRTAAEMLGKTPPKAPSKSPSAANEKGTTPESQPAKKARKQSQTVATPEPQPAKKTRKQSTPAESTPKPSPKPTPRVVLRQVEVKSSRTSRRVAAKKAEVSPKDSEAVSPPKRGRPRKVQDETPAEEPAEKPAEEPAEELSEQVSVAEPMEEAVIEAEVELNANTEETPVVEEFPVIEESVVLESGTAADESLQEEVVEDAEISQDGAVSAEKTADVEAATAEMEAAADAEDQTVMRDNEETHQVVEPATATVEQHTDIGVVEPSEVIESSQLILGDPDITGITVEEVEEAPGDEVILSIADPDESDESSAMTQTIVINDKQTDEITLMDPSSDCVTLPELDPRRDTSMIPASSTHILSEEDILTLQGEEVCPFVEASPVKVKFPKSRPPGAPKQPMVITRENVALKLSQTAEAKKILQHRVVLPQTEVVGAKKTPNITEISLPKNTVTTTVRLTSPKTQDEQTMNLIPVTKTYIVGKDNKIQEVIMKQPQANNTVIEDDTSSQSVEITTDKSDQSTFPTPITTDMLIEGDVTSSGAAVGENAVNVSAESQQLLSVMESHEDDQQITVGHQEAASDQALQAGESDDEEFEHEDEESRLVQEGFSLDDDILLKEDTSPDEGYVIDTTLCNLFDGIKATENITDHYNYWQDVGYKCNHCTESPPTKREFIRHLKAEHFPEIAPWQCPICHFKCLFPAALMLHLNMHTNTTPYACGRCDKSFAYQSTLAHHIKHHDDERIIHCEQCPLYFFSTPALEAHMQRRHLTNRFIYMGDPRAIIQSVAEPGADGQIADDSLDMLSPETGVDSSAVDEGGIDSSVISDGVVSQGGTTPGVVGTGPLKIQTLSGLELGGDTASTSGLNMTVVSGTDVITSNTGNHLVQIMPVSFRNEKGLPETINVVITVPQGDADKKDLTATIATPLRAVVQQPTTNRAISRAPTNSPYNWRGGSRATVDKELLPYCELLPQPIHYNNQKAFIKCTVCADPQLAVHFSSVTQFCDHLRKDHADKDIKPYSCSKCDYKCKVKGNLDQHIKFHNTERPFTCSICGKGFIQRYKLNLHLKFHENKREWKCVECGSSFNDKQDLSRHKKNVHFTKEEGVECPHCERIFKNQYMLEEHVHIHTGEKRYKCEMCEKLYSTRESLRSHMKGHQFQFGCEICAKPLGSYSAFIAHKRLHDPNQKGYTCDLCGKVMLFKATLEAHMKSVHSDVKDFECDFERCGKKFKTPGQLRNHMISHTKEKPYLCQICGYAVKRKDSLRQHMYRHAEVKPYRCGRCGKEYTQKQALEIHLKSKHAGVTTFNCTMCDKGFNTNYLLKKHMQKAHDLELTEKAPRADQVIIAQQQMEDAADCEPPAPEESGVIPPTSKKQTVLINAHICEHCHEVFVSQHALAVHILSEHMSQSRVNAPSVGEDASNVPTNSEDGQVVNISETIEIPIGEEMVLVQSVEPGLLDEAIEKGEATRVPNPDTPKSAKLNSSVSLLQNKSIVVSPDQTIETDMTAEISVIESLASLSEVDTTHTVMTVGGHGPATEIEIDTSGNIVQETIEEQVIEENIEEQIITEEIITEEN